MSKFVVQPNLPLDAAILILGEKYAPMLDAPLKTHGISTLYAPDNPFVDERLSGHADLSVFHAGEERVYLTPFLRSTAFARQLARLGAELLPCNIVQEKSYPNDAQLNIAALGKFFLYCPNVSYDHIVDYLTNKMGMTGAGSRQGYARCQTLIVDERSIITSDAGIARAASGLGLDVLKISAGSVRLSGFPYGFLGGAGFKLSRDRLAFTGTLDGHPDRDEILAFLAARDVEPVFLTDEPLFDIGSAIPLTEK